MNKTHKIRSAAIAEFFVYFLLITGVMMTVSGIIYCVTLPPDIAPGKYHLPRTTRGLEMAVAGFVSLLGVYVFLAGMALRNDIARTRDPQAMAEYVRSTGNDDKKRGGGYAFAALILVFAMLIPLLLTQ